MKNFTETRQVIRNVLDLLNQRQKRQILWITLLMLTSALLNQYTPWAMGWLTDDVLQASSIQIPIVAAILLGIFFVSILNEGLMVIRRLMVEDTATKTEQQARNTALSSLLKAPLYYFRQNMTGNLHGRLNRCLEGSVKLIKLLFMDLIPSIFNSAAAVVVIFLTLPFPLACITVLVIPLGISIVLRQIQTQKGIRVQLLETKAQMDGSIVELLGGIETIRVSDSVQQEEKRLDKKSEQLRKKEMTHHVQMAKYDILKFLNEAVFSVILIGVSVWLAINGRISIGTVLTAYLCFNQLLKPLQELHRILDELSECMVLAQVYFQMTHLPVDFSYTVQNDNRASSSKTSDGAPAVEIENLNFSYPDGSTVIEDLNLEIPQGSFVGFAGASGCGKSSLIKVLCKLEAASGKVKLDGRDLDGLSRKDIAHTLALVPQFSFLFAGTIRENICYGMEIPASPDKLQAAVEKACLSEFIDSLPDGLDTRIAEGGNNLSGGQRQRIAIARIFMREPDLLILDEATSALDNTSERKIQAAIEELQRKTGMTIISIAHRLTTLQNCDVIYVMSDGKIIQKGNYKDLIQEEGAFLNMVNGNN